MTGRRSLHTSKKGLVSISPSSLLTCFMASKDGVKMATSAIQITNCKIVFESNQMEGDIYNTYKLKIKNMGGNIEWTN